MSAGHAIRGAASAALTLIVLEAVGTSGSGRVAGFATDVSNLLAKAIDPKTPLIRDRRGPAGTTDADGNWHPTIPGWLGGGTTTAPGANTSGQQQNPDVVPYDPAPGPAPSYGGNLPPGWASD